MHDDILFPFTSRRRLIEDSDWKSFLSKTSSSTGKKGKEIFLPLRIALSGLTSGPELDDLTELLGKDRVLERFEQAANL